MTKKKGQEQSDQQSDGSENQDKQNKKSSEGSDGSEQQKDQSQGRDSNSDENSSSEQNSSSGQGDENQSDLNSEQSVIINHVKALAKKHSINDVAFIFMAGVADCKLRGNLSLILRDRLTASIFAIASIPNQRIR